jgi:hypothetical protein
LEVREQLRLRQLNNMPALRACEAAQFVRFARVARGKRVFQKARA